MDVQHVNVGTGQDVTINELAGIIKDAVGYEGDVEHDCSKPDGMERKLMDVGRLNNLGWESKIDLARGIKEVVQEYMAK